MYTHRHVCLYTPPLIHLYMTFKWVHAVLIGPSEWEITESQDSAQSVIILVLMVFVVLLWLMERSG